MGLTCVASKAYDAFKQTWLASKLFYYGKRFQHLGEITLIGTVVDCPKKASDGDACFDLAVPGLPTRHCEATPCYPAQQAIARSLKVGNRVRVQGTDTVDPNHHIGPHEFTGGGNEIHPVKDIQLLGGAVL